MKGPSILQIGDVLISSEIITERFCCDYDSCRGACCIIGDSGAPLLEEEASLLERNYEDFKPWMCPAGVEKVESEGFFEIDVDGDIVTPLLRGGEECAFARFEGEACFCAIERSNMAGKCPFVKPISCRLYPIRAKVLRNGMTALNLHRWDICKCAFDKGERENVRVFEFLKRPLTDAYGAEFYSTLCEVAKSFEAAS